MVWALLEEAVARSGCEGIVSFLALDERPYPGFAGMSVGLIATLGVGQAYGDCGVGVPLWVLTQGAVGVGGRGEGVVRPAQGAVWGLGQSLCLEYPDRWGGLIDLPAAVSGQGVADLYAILACPQTEDQLAIRPQGVRARRLYEAPLPVDQVDGVGAGPRGHCGGHRRHGPGG